MNKYLMVLAVLFSACAEDKKIEVEPSNLSVSVDVSPDGSGIVRVSASADNAIFYILKYGDGKAGVRSEDGNGSYQYGASGSYTIVVEAHASDKIFVSQSKTIEVIIKVSIPAEGYSTPTSYDGFTLKWQDEFNATALDESVWQYEIGNGYNGWGNKELEYYKKENTSIDDGHLIITAKRENFEGNSYTSSRLITKDKKSFKYGRVDIRAVLPKGQGIWPALWMLGSNINSVNWPACGEIDIMEMIGGAEREKTVHGTVHWDKNPGYASYGKNYTLASGTFADKFHVFSIVWNETSITWYIDDMQFNVIDITPSELSEFQNEFFFIFNLAVGGNWPGSPDGTTTFPQHLIVDYIRVFQK